jgi:pimeloyl-ACP methyl ester carboxylesterase
MTATVERLDVTSRDGTRLNVERQGAADAPIVLLAHGWTLSAGFYHRLVDELVPDFRVIAYDQRGHGDSGPAGSAGYTPTALADDLAAVLTDGIPAGRQAVLVGHSMGAMTIVALAGRDPDLLHDKAAAALLASTGMDQLLIRNRVVPMPLPVARLARPITAAMFVAPLGSGRNDRASRAMMRRVGLSRTATAADVAYCTGIVQACPAPTRRGFAQMLRDLDLTTSVPALDIPTQVLVGTHDRLTPPWHAARLARALPRCSGVIHVPRAGHMTPLTSADVMAVAVRTLAARHLRVGAPASAPASAPAGTPAGTEED